jgi:trigger factor
MQTVVEPLEGHKVKLSITIDEQEFEKALDATYRKLAREVRIPGFRPGKAPRRIIEAKLGKEAARAEAIRGSLPDYYNEAIREQDVDAIGSPQIDITAGEHDGPVSFDAIVEIRPQVHLAGYGGLRVTVPSPVPTDEEVQAQLDRLRSNFGELVPVGRPARNGDHVTIDLKISRPGQAPDEAATTDDVLYEIGSGNFGPELDEHLRGAVVGDIFKFTADLSQPGAQRQLDTSQPQLNYDVLVKDVKELVLPDVSDEWAGEASEFDTVAELMDDIQKRLALVKRAQAQVALRTQAIEAVAELVQEDPPESLVNEELTRRAQELENGLRQQGLGVGQYLSATGRSQQQLVDELRDQSVQAVKADLALRALADLENLEVSDADVDDEITRLADRFNQSEDQVRRTLESNDQMAAVRSEVRRGKAVEWLVEHVEVVDQQGQLIDRALLEEAPDPEAEDEEAEVAAQTSARTADTVGSTQ